MLLSWVIQYQPSPAEIPVQQVRALESIFLSWVSAADEAFGAELHASQKKPFTVSDLQGRVVRGQNAADVEGQPARLVFAANQPLWWRVTTFSPRLTTLVMEQLQHHLPEQTRFENCGCTLALDKHSLNQIPGHRWAARQSYEELTQRYLLNSQPPGGGMRLRFFSPVAFHKDGRFWLFPTPEQVVGSWLKRWNEYAPVTFPDETRKAAGQLLAVSRYRLETATVQDDSLLRGFCGECTFDFLEADPYWMRVIHTLAAFSFYCGTGVKTARGMGQTRWLYEMARSGDQSGEFAPGLAGSG